MEKKLYLNSKTVHMDERDKKKHGHDTLYLSYGLTQGRKGLSGK